MIQNYFTKPLKIKAIQFDSSPEKMETIQEFGGKAIGPLLKDSSSFSHHQLSIDLPTGLRIQIREGDYIIKDEEGCISTCPSVVFNNIYQEGNIGELSDGYHTFNELYLHRCKLFAVICNTFSNLSWKSLKHADGSMFPEYFIVGITTPEGNFTYHYHIDYWDLFKVKEIDTAPEWDGHTADDIERLFSLHSNVVL